MSTTKTVQSSLSTNNNLMTSNSKNYANFSAFLGGIDVTHQNLDQFTGYIRGISRIYLHKSAIYMNALFPDKTSNFKTIVETFTKSVDGIGDVEVEFTDYEGGFNADKFSSVQSSRDSTDTITISLYELQGSPIREYLDTWISGVRDPRSGVAHYHGLLDDEALCTAEGIGGYGDQYHTCEFVYVTHDPTAKKIEYSCLLANGFPTKVPKSHLNFESGNRDNVQIDLEFRVKKYESAAINDIAAWYTKTSVVKYNYLNFDPNSNGKGWNGSAGQMYTYAYGDGTGAAIGGSSSFETEYPSKNTNAAG